MLTLHNCTGLGLAITKRLCTVMGGNLWCRSQLGKGSSFTFHVPFDTVPEDDSPDSPSSEWQTAPETQQSQLRQQLEPTFSSPPAASALLPTTHNEQSNRNHLSGLRVLVVDDNSLMRKTMNAILSKEQCHVTLAENGQQVPYSAHPMRRCAVSANTLIFFVGPGDRHCDEEQGGIRRDAD
jgi:hypothetical protein